MPLQILPQRRIGDLDLHTVQFLRRNAEIDQRFNQAGVVLNPGLNLFAVALCDENLVILGADAFDIAAADFLTDIGNRHGLDRVAWATVKCREEESAQCKYQQQVDGSAAHSFRIHLKSHKVLIGQVWTAR